jgi:iron complex transport system substrate-binding protein
MTSALLIALAAAPRILSADYCADQLVLALADPSQIAALSVDADKDFSYLREKAAGISQARADAEEIVARDVDVVLRFWGGDEARLNRFGAEVVTLGYAADFDAVKANIAIAAEAIGQAERGKLLVHQIDGRLEALAARGGAPKSALYVTPGGVTAGKGTMIDAIFKAAGVGNIAAERGLSFWPPLSAEALVADPPDYVVTGFFNADSERINHWSAVRHPALKEALAGSVRIDLDADVLSCPGWFSLDAAEQIRDAIERSDR